MFKLLPCFGYCKECCSEHWNACLFLDYMTFSGYMPGSGTAGSYGSSTFSFVILGEVNETENDRYQMISLIRNLRK